MDVKSMEKETYLFSVFRYMVYRVSAQSVLLGGWRVGYIEFGEGEAVVFDDF